MNNKELERIIKQDKPLEERVKELKQCTGYDKMKEEELNNVADNLIGVMTGEPLDNKKTTRDNKLNEEDLKKVADEFIKTAAPEVAPKVTYFNMANISNTVFAAVFSALFVCYLFGLAPIVPVFLILVAYFQNPIKAIMSYLISIIIILVWKIFIFIYELTHK
jgi:hypothetical protein